MDRPPHLRLRPLLIFIPAGQPPDPNWHDQHWGEFYNRQLELEAPKDTNGEEWQNVSCMTLEDKVWCIWTCMCVSICFDRVHTWVIRQLGKEWVAKELLVLDRAKEAVAQIKGTQIIRIKRSQIHMKDETKSFLHSPTHILTIYRMSFKGPSNSRN